MGSWHSYDAGRRLAAQDWPFYALIQAAMRKADSRNLLALQLAFPDTWADLEARYDAPGGFLSGEAPADNADYSRAMPGESDIRYNAGDSASSCDCHALGSPVGHARGDSVMCKHFVAERTEG